MGPISKWLAALLLSGCVVLGGAPVGAEEPATAAGTTEIVKAEKGAKAGKKKGGKKKKKGGKKKGGKKKATSASAVA
ncbi:MAG: hypothetical protein JNM56_08820 [Planctomycetia bacterium]|nr:hypothetical protein [Planctomycetia bacterium]